ncbi:hypothetical protein K4F52_000504 [Lecanicillium sp. MT-2017a]|nr:hypothetical protein K4F52_000504 [Lecanicillium sp. MT-2017a]
MSSPGGFYKYRCKYFYTHNCKNWAEGRDSESAPLPPWALSRDVIVPRVRNGILQYTVMEVVQTAPNEYGEDAYILRAKISRPPPAIPVTTATPKPAGILSTSH